MDRMEFVRRMHSQIDLWNNEVTELAKQKQQFSKDLHEQWDDRSAALRSRMGELKTELQTLESASEEAYGDLKAGVELAAESLKEALQSAKTHFKTH